MKKYLLSAALLLSPFTLLSGSRDAAAAVADSPGQYSLIGWNDLGMHCIDHDYSVFAILPPYNNLHAQLIDRRTGRLVKSGVAITYEAVRDTHGSLNTTSVGKTNFWDWVSPLFGVNLDEDMGLAGNPVQSLTPAPMAYDAAAGFWTATGIPTVPYDDAGNTNYYPMVKVVAKNAQGKVLAATKVVLPVSDEMACGRCHSSGIGDPMAQPSPDWVYDSDPQKDWKRNILLLHDNRNADNPLYAEALTANNYSSAGLLTTADAGTPILCATCHASNALGTPGVAGIKQLTTSMHAWHAVHAMDDNTGMPLDFTMDRTGCYNCHPGSTTQCLRGFMGTAQNPDGSAKLECQSCHGPMSQVGSPDRAGWVDLPKCQYCHYRSADGSYVQDTTAFDATGNFRQTTSIFSTGSTLYKLGATHGNMQCEACHGSTHAEYPTSENNDNVQSVLLQGYPGMVAECTVCHQRKLVVSDWGGPHGLHTIGQPYVHTHANAAKAAPRRCAVCHGKDYRGTRLSMTFTGRSFRTTGMEQVVYTQGQMVGCYDCHNGPGGKLK